jgi:hypothetical protein
MLKYGDVAMYTPSDINDAEFLFPVKPDFDSFFNQTPFEPFSEEAIEFLNNLAVELNHDIEAKKYGEVVSFAFFCRKANILALKKKHTTNSDLRLGRGVVFHIAPSNVAVNFAYSMVSGILTGNLNIIRVPSKRFEQVDLICSAIARLNQNKKNRYITDRLLLVRYDRKSSLTDYFSSHCDIRIIWGGDATIEQIRKVPIPPRAIDITFADRYSICAIDADVFVDDQYPEKTAKAFYNDTYLFDQNACSSPHLIIWLGTKINVEKSQQLFWTNLYDVVKKRYNIQSVIAVDKLTALYNQASRSESVVKVSSEDNLLWRIRLETLPEDIENYRCSSGYFSEYHAESLMELSKIINRKYQTLAYYGIENKVLAETFIKLKPYGIDRIVPIGRTSDFSLTWDGYDLTTTLTRRCELI